MSEKHPNPSPEGGRPSELRILIVDDHPLFRDGLGLLLKSCPGSTVVGRCGDIATAWAAIEQLRPDLVLLDIDLPDGSGISLARRVAAAFREVKMIVLTSYLRRDFAAEAIAAGARGYIVKTMAPEELLTAIATVRQGGIHMSGDLDAGADRLAAKAKAPEVAPGRRELPPRERQVLNLILQGLRNKEIAAELKLSVKTVETYRARLMDRFGCGSPAELVRCAFREGFASL